MISGRHAIIIAVLPFLFISSIISLPRSIPCSSHMANSPQNPRILLNFRAPPPSPAAGPHKISPDTPDDDEFSGFLNRSRRVPDLILPHRILQRDSSPWKPPEIDLRALISPEDGGSAAEILRSAARSLGCFQIVNHGLEVGVVVAAVDAATGIFRLSSEVKKEAMRSPERRWGFEMEEEEEVSEGDEFFWWSGRGEEMAGIWSQEYSTLSVRVERLLTKMEEIARMVELVLGEFDEQCNIGSCRFRRESNGMVICLRKHGRSKGIDDGLSLNHDMLGALIRSLGCSYSLGFHIFMGASRFRVYYKRAPISFRPTHAAIVVTVGDQMQAKSGGIYKHVIGKPEYDYGDAAEHPISLAFLNSHALSEASAFPGSAGAEEEKSISLSQQLMVAACLLLFYNIIAYLCFGKV